MEKELEELLNTVEKEKQLALVEALHAMLIVDGNSERCGRALCTVLAYLCPNEKAVEGVKENVDFYYQEIQKIKANGVGRTLFDFNDKKAKS